MIPENTNTPLMADCPSAPCSAAQPIATAPAKGCFLIWLPSTSLWWPAYGLGKGKVASNSHGTVNIPKDQDRYSPEASHWMSMPDAPNETSPSVDAIEKAKS